MDADVEIREVEPGKAEAVLTIRLFVPGVAEGGADAFPLARVRTRWVAEVGTVTVGPDGTVTETGTLSSDEEVVVAHCTYADGRTANGQGFGSGKTVSIEGRSATEVAVRLSMYWTAHDGDRGRLDVELVVPWGGIARKDLGGGRWVAADITPVEQPAKPGVAPDRRPL